MIKQTLERLRNGSVFSLLLILALLAALWATGTAGANAPAGPAAPASAPTVLNYQGIVKVDDEPFAGSTGHFKFAIVNAFSGDGTTNYWANDGTASGEPGTAVELAVSEGLFNVLLGDTGLAGMSEPIDATVFATEPAYLRVWFSPSGSAGPYEALDPNQRIASVAYALWAAYAENGPPGQAGQPGLPGHRVHRDRREPRAPQDHKGSKGRQVRRVPPGRRVQRVGRAPADPRDLLARVGLVGHRVRVEQMVLPVRVGPVGHRVRVDRRESKDPWVRWVRQVPRVRVAHSVQAVPADHRVRVGRMAHPVLAARVAPAALRVRAARPICAAIARPAQRLG